MIIVNDEELLKVYDIENGWDWIKILGVIIMNLSFYEMLFKKVRYFSLWFLVGGVIFKGLEFIVSGFFVMDFY